MDRLEKKECRFRMQCVQRLNMLKVKNPVKHYRQLQLMIFDQCR